MKNNLPQSIIDKIPKGSSKAAIAARRDIINSYLKKYVGKNLNNKHLNNNLKFTNASLKEICWWASKSYESTIVALNIKCLVENAGFLEFSIPKYGNQSKKIGSWVTIILHSTFENKEIKITVCDSIKYNPENKKCNLIIYCITAKNVLHP